MRGLGPVVLGTILLTAATAAALPTPGFFGAQARDATGRLFPEAMQTNDYVGFFEAQANLQLLAEENPDLVEYFEVAQSAGWDNAGGGHDTLPVMVVALTNKQSAVPLDRRVNLLFMLSIHGNEKGAREGGFRIIEDFVKAGAGDTDVGVATPERLAALDYQRLIFLFPNPDGWSHEELEYRQNSPGYFNVGPVETQNFVRVNGNGVDLNRQTPTQGWSRGEGSHQALSQPEPQGYVNWLKTEYPKIHFATDIHGMLQPANAFINSSRPIQCVPAGELPDGVPFIPGGEEVCLREGNFLLTLLPAGRFTPREEVLITGLAELLKENINADPFFAEWQALPGAGVWGGDFNGWGTVWDTIGYVDSGFSGDWFAQDTGLDAPGMDFELSYNHIVFDNYYPGLGQRINAYHVQAVRHIIATFMDIAALNTQVTIDSHGTRSAWVPTRIVATDLDDKEALTGWAAENAADDAYDIDHVDFTATINDYFGDLAAVLSNGELPGVLDAIEPEELAQALADYENVIIPGSAVRPILDSQAAIEALREYVGAGGNLVLTDEALQLLGPLGIVDDADIEVKQAYAGYTNWADREHALAAGIRGMARQFFEPMPIGYEEGDTSPVWSVSRSAFEEAGGMTVGTLGPGRTNLGEVALGEGRVGIIGALLPDPTEEYYHPYGLASYATTYTGNQVLRNALGWELRFEQPPRVTEAGIVLPDEEDEAAGQTSAGAGGDEDSTPLPGLVPIVALAAGVAMAVRRRRAS